MSKLNDCIMENTFFNNEHLFKQLRERNELLRIKPEKIYPWWRRACKVKVLLLTDGGLDFGTGDFGLSTFVSILANDGRHYVDFEMTIAHRNGFVGDPGVAVARSIPNFRFTNNNHFTSAMYDQIWFFGVESNGGLSNDELTLVSAFMNSGGGVFATGDHGSLGRAMCGNLPRVRKMRRWDNASGEVGMDDPRRNDTNRPGHDAGSQFDDQSDDIPQTIQPRLYSSTWGGFWRETYPHPILCSPLGRITVLPDHPHEGECIEPTNLVGNYEIDNTPEFPGGVGPQIIAHSTVLAGSTGGTKQATQAQTFGAICAYDGHSANVGRVVTDATWHHFVNVNLVGELEEPNNTIKGQGFLASTTGQQHLAQIKHYYINVAVWIARPSNHTCFQSRLVWQLVFQHRVMEATMDDPTLRFDRISPVLLYSIGTHATDVLGRKASQCRRLKLLIDIVRPVMPDFARLIDPWILERKFEKNPPIPWFDYNPLIAMAMGGGLIACRDKFVNNQGLDPNKIDAKEIMAVFQDGAKQGLEVAFKEFNADLKKLSNLK
jgi:hypothetical protein